MTQLLLFQALAVNYGLVSTSMSKLEPSWAKGGGHLYAAKSINTDDVCVCCSHHLERKKLGRLLCSLVHLLKDHSN